ncbi:hypothetical protein D3C87_29800 [compost metagenome]
MKQTFLFSILIICISCFSCDKEKNRIQRFKRGLRGNWEWINSTSGKNGETSSPLITHSPSTTGSNYGLRIGSSNNAFLYENGKQIKKGKLESVEEMPINSTNNYRKITFDFEGEQVIFLEYSETYEPTKLSSTIWPYKNHSNQLNKNK